MKAQFSLAPRVVCRAFAAWTFSALASVGCIYDEKERCGDDREFKNGLCMCKADEIDQDGECVSKPDAPAALGDECNATDKTCEDEVFSECHSLGDDVCYCTTTGCKDDDECGGDYYCAMDADPSFCKRVPTGQGTPCMTQADCDDFDANFCSLNPLGPTCSVKDCSADGCSPGYACMDFSQFMPGAPKLCAKPF